MLEFDQTWRVCSVTEIKDVSGILKNDDGFRAHGFEDCRLVQAADGGFFASASVRNLNPDLAWQCSTYGSVEMAVLELNESWEITGVDVIRDFGIGCIQKNWMPISGKDRSWVYTCDPTIVIAMEDGKIRQCSSNRPNVCLSDLRGGSQVVPYRDGWLCLAHEVAHIPERVYLHRFVVFDAAFKIEAISDPFYFARRDGVEFCAGLAWDRGLLVASFGTNDGGQSHLCFFPMGYLNTVLYK